MEDTVADTGNKSGGDQSMRGGGVPRRRCGSGFRSLLKAELYPSSLDPIAAINVPAGSWTAFNIALSALFYLFDFATDLLTLRTYYYYSVLCPKYIYNSSPRPAPLDLPHECNVIMEGLSFRTVFYVCISLMAAAHLSNTLIFWVTLDPSEHPLGYFLPLIHLSRLLKVLWRTGTCGGSLEDVQDRGQKESSSLYNVLAASLETAPQLMLQFHVFCQLGERDGYGNEVPERVPKTLIVSLVASLVSGTYTGSVAVLSLLQKRAGIMEPQLRRWTACIGMLAVRDQWESTV